MNSFSKPNFNKACIMKMQRNIGHEFYSTGDSLQGQQVQQQRRSKRSHAANTIEARTKAPTVQYICKDCGWIYDGRQSFESLDKSYRCPVCNSPKRRYMPGRPQDIGLQA